MPHSSNPGSGPAPAPSRVSEFARQVDGADSPAANRRSRLLRTLQTQAIAAVLLVLIVVFSMTSPYFLNVENFLIIGRTVALLGIMAVTQTFLVVSKGIDISIGSVAALTGVLLGFFFSAGLDIWVSSGLALAVAASLGFMMGQLVVRLDLDPLIVSLGGFSIFAGLAFVISGTKTLVLSDSAFRFLGAGEVFGVPFALVVFLAVFSLALFVEKRTVAGRTIYAIGGNEEAARLAGIQVSRIRITLYTLSGFSAGIAGVFLASQLSTSSPNVGAAFLLSVVTAVVLGGASLNGGRGSLIGTLLAVAVLGVLQNGFALLAFSSFAQQIVLGSLLIAAVALDTVTRRLGV